MANIVVMRLTLVVVAHPQAGRKRGYVVHEPSKAPFSSADDKLPFPSDSTYRDFCMHAKPHPRQPYVQRRTRHVLETMTGPDHFGK